MSLEDRHWYKEDFDRRMGKGRKKEPEKPESAKASPQPEAKKAEPKPKEKPKVERVKKYKATKEEERTYNNAPPAHTILAAKYELAIRARTKKTFWAGFALGSVVASAAAYMIMPLL